MRACAPGTINSTEARFWCRAAAGAVDIRRPLPMSFQGDVAGLGLGELLQGLARGGREGVLTLRGGALSARLGVCDGQLQLLHELDEDSEQWRKRSERAWVRDPDQRIDSLRMSEIAHAARLEVMFQLLDCEGVHFRFEPGPILTEFGDRNADAEQTQLARVDGGTKLERLAPVTCPPISVEYVLLEYARLTDELASQPGAAAIPHTLVPCVLSEEAPERSLTRLWQECDGMSTLREIGDRLGWPIRQVRCSLAALYQHGAIRAAGPSELLVLAQKELAANRLARAAARVSGWCDFAPPGPAAPGELELLLAEWDKGKLPAALASMDARSVRTLLRRLEPGASDASTAIARWRESRKHHKHDAIAELRLLHWQHRSQNDADAPAMSDLLRVARKFQDSGQNWRAAIVLRTAAARGPETTSVRLEIGQRLIAVGEREDGAAWVVEACRGLLLGNAPDKAIGPLRQLLDAQPSHREAKALLNVAHGKTVVGKRTRRNSVIVLSAILALSTVAVVKVRSDTHHDARLEQVRELHSDPDQALKLLAELFDDSSDSDVQALRSELEARVKHRANEARAQWIAQFQRCQLECASGDPALGLRDALRMPPAPPEQAGETPLPTLELLLEGLAAGLEQTLADWGEATEDSNEAMHTEARMTRLVADLLALVHSSSSREELTRFGERVSVLSGALAQRSGLRAAAREQRLRDSNLAQQEQLLISAREHARAGDLESSVESYAKLAHTPDAEPLMRLLDEELGAVTRHRDAVREARALAERGEHAKALEVLSRECAAPSEHLLPCRIDSLPHGARARFNDGASRVTPFVLETAPGVPTTLHFEHEGFEPTRISIETPGNLTVLLSRTPERAWPSTASVLAAPVPVDDDHIVCDRSGRVARMSKQSGTHWSRQLESISGVARTPVFLPKRPGTVLVLTEEGSAWLVDANDGKVEGPQGLRSSPIAGPQVTPSGARVQLHDGRELIWTSRLAPDQDNAAAAGEAPNPDRGHDAGLAMLRRNPQTQTLASPWGDWTVEVAERDFVVRRSNASNPEFGVQRVGEWNYLAWEAPRARAPRGRLWISDGFGLRAFTP